MMFTVHITVYLVMYLEGGDRTADSRGPLKQSNHSAIQSSLGDCDVPT